MSRTPRSPEPPRSSQEPDDSSPLRVYPVRSSRVMLVVTALVSVLCFGAVGWLLTSGALDLLTHGTGARWPLGLVGLALLLVPFAYLFGLANEQIAGGSGEVRVFGSHVEVPAAFRGGPLRFSLRETHLEVKRFEGRLAGATVSAVQVLHLRGPRHSRALSSRVFERPEALRTLALDLEALQRGEALPDHESRTAPRERDAYDDQLDAELDELS